MGVHWTDKRRALANIGEELARRGWTLYGYHEDQSDGMTDYWCPATWRGVAEKDDFVACVDVEVWLVNEKRNGDTTVNYENDAPCPHCTGTGHEPDGWTYAQAQANPTGYNRQRCAKTSPGAIPLLAHVLSPLSFRDGREMCHKCNGGGYTLRRVETVNPWPKFQPNPGTKKWHVETGGQILASGTGIYSAARSAATVQQICDRIEAACAAQPNAIMTAGPVTGAIVAENPAKDGVEIRFPAKPSTAVLDAIRAAGFRWSPKQRLWWAKRTPERLTLARRVAEGC